jgi:prophage regulatory protein
MTADSQHQVKVRDRHRRKVQERPMDDRAVTDTQHEAPEKKEVREMLTAEQVLARIPVSRTTLFRLERDKLFPQGQAIGLHRKLWFQML